MQHQNKILKEYKKLRSLFDMGATFTVIDTETTGISPTSCQIIEIGAVKFNKDGIISTYSQLFNPQQIIPPKIVDLTHIDNNMVINQPLLKDKFPEFLSYIGDTILMGHNIQFDLNFINTACLNLELPVTKNKAIDTLRFSIWAYPHLEKHKQEFLADYFKIDKGSAHRAFDDSITCMNIFLKLLESPKVL